LKWRIFQGNQWKKRQKMIKMDKKPLKLFTL